MVELYQSLLPWDAAWPVDADFKSENIKAEKKKNY
jgi:hypothetical protein